MSSNDKYDKIKSFNEDDESGDQGSGGQGSGIAFVDFTSPQGERRDDQRSEEEIKHLLNTHPDVHEDKVKHQKEKIEQNKNKKEGKVNYAFNAPGGPGGGGGGDWKYKDNPELKNFGHGVDNPGLPNEFQADTNKSEQDALQEELRLQFGMQPKPTAPRPQGPY